MAPFLFSNRCRTAGLDFIPPGIAVMLFIRAFFLADSSFVGRGDLAGLISEAFEGSTPGLGFAPTNEVVLTVVLFKLFDLEAKIPVRACTLLGLKKLRAFPRIPLWFAAVRIGVDSDLDSDEDGSMGGVLGALPRDPNMEPMAPASPFDFS
jgi:hypothetical protein